MSVERPAQAGDERGEANVGSSMAARSELWNEREADELMRWDCKIYLDSSHGKIVRQEPSEWLLVANNGPFHRIILLCPGQR